MVLNDSSLLLESEETLLPPTRAISYRHMTLIRLLFSICLIIANFGITFFVVLLYYIGRAIRRSLPWDYVRQFLNDYPIIDDDFGSIFDDDESSDREDLSDGEESILPVRDDPSDKSEDDDEFQSMYEGDESFHGEASDTIHNRLLFINPPLRNNDEKLDNDGDLLDEDVLNSMEGDDYSFKGEDFDRMCEEILRNPLDDEDYSLEDQDLDVMCDRIMRGLFYINPHLRVRVAWIDPTDDFLNDSDTSPNKDELNNADDQDYSLKGDDCDRMRDENFREELDNDDSFQDLDRLSEQIIRGLLYINPPFRARLEWIDSAEELYDDDILLNKDEADEIMRGFDYLLKMVARRKGLSFFCQDRGVLECDDIAGDFDYDDDLLGNNGSESKEDDDYSFNGEDYDRICDMISCEPLGDDDCSLESEDLDKLYDDTMRRLFFINPPLRARVACIDRTEYQNDYDDLLDENKLENSDDDDYSFNHIRNEILYQQLHDDLFQDLDRMCEKNYTLLLINPPIRSRLEWTDSAEQLYDDDALLNKNQFEEINRGINCMERLITRGRRLLECYDIFEELDDELDSVYDADESSDDYDFDSKYDDFYEEHDWIYEDEFENRDDDDAFEDFDGMCGEMRGDALEDLLESVTFELVVICSICIASIIRFFYWWASAD